ncbi:MAG: hypothetical protein IJI45_18490 [Anaerolineaceae bacterium]|nr:hypothetical protein [Anaerolineaceae bacterium]
MDIQELINYLFTPIAQVALIIGIAELVKKIGLKSKWIPLIDLGLGLASGIGVFGLALNHGIVEGAIVGVALGLSACGLFSGVKNLTEKVKSNDD